MRGLGHCTEQQNKMVFFAIHFLKQLEQNDRVLNKLLPVTFTNNLQTIFINSRLYSDENSGVKYGN